MLRFGLSAAILVASAAAFAAAQAGIYALGGLGPGDRVLSAAAVGLAAGWGLGRASGAARPPIAAWAVTGALAWSVAALVSEQAREWAVSGHGPRLDWWIRLTPPGAEHPGGITVQGGEAIAGAVAALGSALPALLLGRSRLRAAAAWADLGAVSAAAWAAIFTGRWVA